MKKFTKIACITAGIMFAIGAILAISGILAGAKTPICRKPKAAYLSTGHLTESELCRKKIPILMKHMI